jgi:hypothetical protein
MVLFDMFRAWVAWRRGKVTGHPSQTNPHEEDRCSTNQPAGAAPSVARHPRRLTVQNNERPTSEEGVMTDPGPSPPQRARRALAELALAEEKGIPREGAGSFPTGARGSAALCRTFSTTSSDVCDLAARHPRQLTTGRTRERNRSRNGDVMDDHARQVIERLKAENADAQLRADMAREEGHFAIADQIEIEEADRTIAVMDAHGLEM